MSNLAAELQKQIRQAEELLFSGPQEEGFAKGLFFGEFRQEAIYPYPRFTPEQQAQGDAALAKVKQFAQEKIDPVAIDRNADIPPDVIQGLGDVGVLGATIPREFGGQALSQQNYCRIMEVIGARCAATAVFVNAHHSIGLRALNLFGTDAQKKKWLKPLAAGQILAAFALTEEQAGSDASNVQTRARVSGDGKGYILTGSKRYITNGGIAQVLTVMARTPDPQDEDGKVTAFLVTPDMPGFQVIEPRMPKCGIKGTATAKLAFNEMYVPKENVLGSVGKGLRVALTVLDFGRTTFGASCTGAAKFCLEKAVEHARTRKQFGKTLGEFGLVKQKIAQMAANIYAMESATYHTAALIDRGAEDFMIETAMLKVFASDALWTIVNDTLQIYGGAGYFNDQPFERMMRDARINTIGEGANDVLRCFIPAVGLRPLGMQMQEVLKKPWQVKKLWRGAPPAIPIVHALFQPAVSHYSRQILSFARACEIALFRHREGIVEQQYVLARLGDIATDLFLSGCVYSRLMSHFMNREHYPAHSSDLHAGLLFMKSAARRNAVRLAELKDNDDHDHDRTAELLLGRGDTH